MVFGIQMNLYNDLVIRGINLVLGEMGEIMVHFGFEVLCKYLLLGLKGKIKLNFGLEMMCENLVLGNLGEIMMFIDLEMMG